MLTPKYWSMYGGVGILCGESVWPLLAIWVVCFCVSTGVWGVGNCPVPVLVRYGTFVVRRSGTGGTLLYGIGVASGAVPVPYRYGTGTGTVLRYGTVPVQIRYGLC
jgi:hypothetical protein